MSDDGQQANEDMLRARRRDALRELAREQTGELPVAHPANAPAHGQSASRRGAWRIALIALSVCLVLAALAGGGIFAVTRMRASQPTIGSGSHPQPTAAPSCLPHAPASTGAATPAVTENIRVSDDTYKAHSEPMVAINPANPRNLVGGSKMFTDTAHYEFQIGTYTSFDGGCTWTDNGVLPGFAATELTSDVSIAFGPDNRVYAAVLYTDNKNVSGIAVSASTDGGKTFGLPVRVFENTTGAVFSDKPWLTVDMSGGHFNGSVYVVWSYDHGGTCGFDNACQQNLAFSRSSDNGATFSPVQWVGGSAPFCSNPATGRAPDSRVCDGALGAIPAILPNGMLAVAFDYMDVMSTGKIPTRLAVVTSRDGGAHWAAPTLIATIADISGVFPPNRYRVASLPAFAADPMQNKLYIAWADKSRGDADILFSSSSDAGQTWSKPIRVNDDAASSGANQFQPQLAVAPNGVVTVSFFDTRLDHMERLIDVYLAQSVDGGASFLPNVRVTTQSWNPDVDAPVDGAGQQFIGDYQGLAVTNEYACPFWNDTRTRSQEIFTALVPSAQPKR